MPAFMIVYFIVSSSSSGTVNGLELSCVYLCAVGFKGSTGQKYPNVQFKVQYELTQI